jgi:hypothetical protein
LLQFFSTKEENARCCNERNYWQWGTRKNSFGRSQIFLIYKLNTKNYIAYENISRSNQSTKILFDKPSKNCSPYHGSKITKQ